jgi:ribonuclease P/MRP protein subunit POP5
MVRFKQRYLLAQVLVEKGHTDPTSKDLYSAVTGRVTALLGIWGFGAVKASLQIKYWNANTGYLILRVTRSFVRPVWMALISVRELAGRPCAVSVVHCGGTVRGAKLQQLKQQKFRAMVG